MSTKERGIELSIVFQYLFRTSSFILSLNRQFFFGENIFKNYNIDPSAIRRFQTDDGSSRQETGSVKQLGNEEANSITGEYSWTSPEGELISFSYVADENGFQPQVTHLIIYNY
jgi:hypothetical protein